MKATGQDSKFKYLQGIDDTRFINSFLGEAHKHSFEGINVSSAATESNFIRSNGQFVAVSIYGDHVYVDSMEQRRWRCDRSHESIRVQKA